MLDVQYIVQCVISIVSTSVACAYFNWIIWFIQLKTKVFLLMVEPFLSEPEMNLTHFGGSVACKTPGHSQSSLTKRLDNQTEPTCDALQQCDEMQWGA